MKWDNTVKDLRRDLPGTLTFLKCHKAINILCFEFGIFESLEQEDKVFRKLAKYNVIQKITRNFGLNRF